MKSVCLKLVVVGLLLGASPSYAQPSPLGRFNVSRIFNRPPSQNLLARAQFSLVACGHEGCDSLHSGFADRCISRCLERLDGRYQCNFNCTTTEKPLSCYLATFSPAFSALITAGAGAASVDSDVEPGTPDGDCQRSFEETAVWVRMDDI